MSAGPRPPRRRRRRPNRAVFAAALAALLVAGTPASAAAPVLAVVVHRSSPVDAVRLDELRELYLGKSRGVGGHDCVALQLSSKTAARGFFSDRALRMSKDEYRDYWLKSRLFEGGFGGVRGAKPKAYKSARSILALTKKFPDRIGYIPWDPELDGVLRGPASSWKILPVDGLGPGEPGYPLAPGR